MTDLADRLDEIADDYEAIIRQREAEAEMAGWFALLCVVVLGGALVGLAVAVAMVVY